MLPMCCSSRSWFFLRAGEYDIITTVYSSAQAHRRELRLAARPLMVGSLTVYERGPSKRRGSSTTNG